MNKNDPNVLVALNNLYVIIEHHYPRNVYKMMKHNCFLIVTQIYFVYAL